MAERAPALMDYGRVYLAGWRWSASDAEEYIAVIWSPDEGGGKAKESWRGAYHTDPEDAFREMESVAKKRRHPVEIWKHGNVRVGVVGGSGRKRVSA